MFLPDNFHTRCHDQVPRDALVEPHSAKGFDHPNHEKPKQMEDFADPVQLDPDQCFHFLKVGISSELFESCFGSMLNWRSATNFLLFDVQKHEEKGLKKRSCKNDVDSQERKASLLKMFGQTMYSSATGQFGKKHHGFGIMLDLKIVRQIPRFISHANAIHVWYIRLHDMVELYSKLQFRR